jgi:multidrug transporter EmrE-like cation transporter
MKRIVLLGFLLLLTFDTAAQVCMKLAGERIGTGELPAWLGAVVREPLIYLVLACYLGAFATYVSLLKVAPVGPAYAAAHGHIVTVLLISVVFFGERLTILQAMGALAIFAGVTGLAVLETATASAKGEPQATSPADT